MWLYHESPMAQPGKVPTCTAGDVGDAGLIPGWEDPLEEGIATHSSILAWEMPWKRILVGYSPKNYMVGQD